MASEPRTYIRWPQDTFCDPALERVVRSEIYRTRPVLTASDLAEVRAVYAVVWVIVADEVKDVIRIYSETD